MKQAIIVFQKALILGEVKTRLAATLGEEDSLNIYRQLLEHTHKVVASINNTSVFIFQNKFPERLPISTQPHFHFFEQQGKDLGEKMFLAFQEVFNLGFTKVLIIGTDCIDLTKTHLSEAMNQLDRNTCVIGPATDGGYYLLGLTRPVPELFRGIQWSSPEVFNDSVSILNSLQITFSTIETLSDIDTEEDLKNYRLKNSLLSNDKILK